MDNKTNPEKSTKAVSKKENAKVSLPEENLWPSLYAVTQHWQSDVKFFEDELSFFRLLIDKHLALLIDSKNIEQTRTMVSHVVNLEKDRISLAEKISLYIEHITRLIENPFAQNTQGHKEDHGKLENDFAAFVKKFRAVKSEVFKLTERIIHSEKVKRLIDWG